MASPEPADPVPQDAPSEELGEVVSVVLLTRMQELQDRVRAISDRINRITPPTRPPAAEEKPKLESWLANATGGESNSQKKK
jgi:hypothetical protein